MMREEEEIRLATLVAEVRASNDVLHLQLKHLHEIFSEKLDRIHSDQKATNEIIDKHDKRILDVQEKLSEIKILKLKIHELTGILNTNVEECNIKFKNINDEFKVFEKDLDILKSETEIVRVEQKNPEFAKAISLGKLVRDITVMAAAAGVLYKLFFN